ncbi:nitrate regulatory protein [Gynuella sunshinyii]|uniref:Response regulator with putative antiterminator output domain n=1 Tax=Gynuella sunshinyii YC6258 TaxID=1445510 RepID=A0A0C5VKR0_9GAMM|nr:nitrate regulatory protein [Gynuella sunshinyii]AJQ93988.1 response regulator with putative antiterminator output domain [Gynuella sunshinyii YC6258]
MTARLHTPEDFLLAAKRAEIRSFRQLAINCELTLKVSMLVHALQRERGLSNGYLKSDGQRFREQRLTQIELCHQAEQQFHDSLKQISEQNPFYDSRLLSSIAFVIQALNELSILREKTALLRSNAIESTHAISSLIAGLLAVVFEAADISNDPDITRAMVAMFNFMQGKEYAGQERAWGAIGFTAGQFEQEQLDRLKNLIHAQQRCFDIFEQLASAPIGQEWSHITSNQLSTEIQKLRTVLHRLSAKQAVSTELSEIWYDLTTERIDKMHILEQQLSADLMQLSQSKLKRAQQELEHFRSRIETSMTIHPPSTRLLNLPLEQTIAPSAGTTVYHLLQDQAKRLQQLSDELAEARQALTERKLLERAKGLLMQHRQLTEEQAYRQLRESAMESNQTLTAVAQKVIEAINHISVSK